MCLNRKSARADKALDDLKKAVCIHADIHICMHAYWDVRCFTRPWTTSRKQCVYMQTYKHACILGCKFYDMDEVGIHVRVCLLFGSWCVSVRVHTQTHVMQKHLQNTQRMIHSTHENRSPAASLSSSNANSPVFLLYTHIYTHTNVRTHTRTRTHTHTQTHR